MTEQADGVAAAHDATVVVVNNVGALEAALAEARRIEEEAGPQRRIDAAKAAIAKAEAQLAGARDALRQAIADNRAETTDRAAAIVEKAARRAAAEQEGN